MGTIGKLEKKCPFFARLDRIWGTWPNFRPPSSFSSAASSQETTVAADSLIHALQSTQNAVEIDDDDDLGENNEPEAEFPSKPASDTIPVSPLNTCSR